MIVTQLMSAMADAAAQRYGMLTDAWAVIYSRALDDARLFGSAQQLNDVEVAARELALRYIDAEHLHTFDTLAEIAQSALTATHDELRVSVAEDAADALDEPLNEFASYLMQQIALQAERDLGFLLKNLRDTYLTVALIARSQRLPARTALLQHRIGTATTPLEFAFHDRRNTRWSARRYMRSIWRHSLIAAYNDVVLMTLADHGIETAQIKHNDPNSEWHGQEVTIAPSTSLPTYADVRDQAFHPNAEAVLVRSL